MINESKDTPGRALLRQSRSWYVKTYPFIKNGSDEAEPSRVHIIIPEFANWPGPASQVAFITDLRIYNDAAEYYMNVTGEFLEDSSSGQLPAGWETFVNEAEWTAGTPIGGVWDFELDSFGLKSAFGVHFMNGPRKDDTFMTEVDAIVDDGDLASGAFRKIASDRYYLVVRMD